MGSSRHDDNDGSNIFWPGYVDATTNLILNLLFLLTILIVAVFMFALELGRTSPKTANNPIKNKTVVTAEATDPVAENVILKREIKELKARLAQREAKPIQSDLTESVDASLMKPRSQHGVEGAVVDKFDTVIRFKNEAINFTAEEHELLLKTLNPVATAQRARIIVDVPAGFTETKRMAFYRAMAVRNILIEMNVPTDAIDVLIIEGSSDANAALVKVKAN